MASWVIILILVFLLIICGIITAFGVIMHDESLIGIGVVFCIIDIIIGAFMMSNVD